MKGIVFGAGAAVGIGMAVLVTAYSYQDIPRATPETNDAAIDAADSASINADAAVADGGPVVVLGSPDASIGTLTLNNLGAESSSGAGASGRAGDPTGHTVRFGVVLVTFAGAQGAPTGARDKGAARVLAGKLADEAKNDFHAAVSHGDSGSQDDAGRIERGVLEAEVEASLFALEKGATSAPIETPRGFWIVRRVD